MKQFNIKSLATCVSLTMAAAATGTAHASDIEIYQTPDESKNTILMMLDISGSMWYCDSVPGYNTEGAYGVHNIHIKGGRKIVQQRATQSGVNYNVEYCQLNGRNYPTRENLLKSAVMGLMDSDQIDDLYLALGTFDEGKKGVIHKEAKKLTPEYRKEIQQFISNLSMGGWTPTTHAYIEAVAYMLGGSTKMSGIMGMAPTYRETFRQYGSDRTASFWENCNAWNRELSCIGTTHTYEVWSNDPNGTGADNHPSWTRRQPFKNFKAPAPCRVPVNGWTCLIAKDAPLETPQFDLAAWSREYGNFDKSVSTSKDGNHYKSPLPPPPKPGAPECNGQAIYYLMDGYATDITEPPQFAMKSLLKDKGSDFPIDTLEFTKPGYLDSTANGLAQAGELSKRLYDPSKNPSGVRIKTAIVGLGSVFNQASDNKRMLLTEEGKPRTYYNCAAISNERIKTVCNWGERSHKNLPGVGGYGQGGFFHARTSKDIIESFLQVAQETKVEFQPTATGSPTIPVDSLNRQQVLDDAYYASFLPQPMSSQQLWLGNMDKYKTINGRLTGKNNADLFGNNGFINESTLGLWSSSKDNKGVASKLKLRNTSGGRILYTNRTISGSNANDGTTMQRVTLDALKNGALANDSAKNYWLNLLGYNIPIDTAPNFDNLNAQAPELRQMGATLHSNPILLTQQGKLSVGADGQLTSTDREDYLLYGSTQGLLHVVDAKTGDEKFAFAPNEMVNKQKEAFLQKDVPNGGKNNLFYGIDAPWVSHTQYVSKLDGTLTVNQSDITYRGNTSNDINIRGLQWVYGGLRMGGKSYYALDLSDINNPKFKFHIDPENQKIHSADTTVNTKNFPELQFMGQSWSKPSLGYVKWNGERKLVMFVGGGYDAGNNGKAGYEATNYQQTDKKGAGVYMFDANSGELLWWASANTVANGSVTKHSVQNDDTSTLQYSIATQINALDRDNDGYIDNLYFGDLAGQGFRIDLDNNNKNNQNQSHVISKRVVRLFSEHKADGTSPRFYDMPSISVHTKDGNTFAAVAFGSGDRSSPLAGGTNRPTANDGTFVVYDYDLPEPTLMTLPIEQIKTRANGKSLQTYNAQKGVDANVQNLGWKFIYPNNAGDVKSMGSPYAVANLLFINTYNKNETAPSQANTCGGGVIGASSVYQLCLPTGQCTPDMHGYDTTTEPEMTFKQSASVPGLVEITLGSAVGNKNNIGNISPLGQSNIDCEANPSRPECLNVETPASLKQLRWYEARKERG